MPELAIEEVTTPAQLVEFEAAAIEGFEAPQLHGLGSLGLHAAEILHDPRMKIYAGRVGGRVVSVSMAYLDSQVVGVYGVATLPAYRRRGFGEAMTWRAVLSQPDWPAVLQPSPLGAPVYRRMGFQEIGRFTSWFYPGIGE
jgi:GNAT superfamily N-acetyltransferase